MKFLAAVVLATLSLTVLMEGTNFAQDKKVSIKEVMKVTMKEGLLKKCAGGMGTDADKKQLVEMFTALAADTPPKGDLDSWKKKTGALVDAAKKVAAGEDGAGKTLQAAANCMACHKEHKK